MRIRVRYNLLQLPLRLSEYRYIPCVLPMPSHGQGMQWVLVGYCSLTEEMKKDCEDLGKYVPKEYVSYTEVGKRYLKYYRKNHNRVYSERS